MFSKMETMKNSALILMSVCFLCSCAMYHETYHNPDRTCGMGDLHKHPLINDCKAYISFQCTDDIVHSEPIQTHPGTLIYVTQLEGIVSPYVGTLRDHWNSKIYIKGISPWTTLHNDIVGLLTKSGYSISEKQENAITIEVDIGYLGLSYKSGWTKGSLKAIVNFSARLRQGSSKTLWSEYFIGESEMDISYAYLKDYEKTLGKAYCNALQNFYDSIQTQVFSNLVN